MSNIDKRALREAAEKATKGQWAVEFDDEIYSTDGVNHEQIAMVFSENEASDAAFIAAANPDTVLALLDELEAAEKLIAELGVREVKPVAWMWERDGKRDVDMDNPDDGVNRIGAKKAIDAGWKCSPLYAAPPAPVSVPDEMTMQEALSAIDRLSWQECTRDAYMIGWNACRAAMLIQEKSNG